MNIERSQITISLPHTDDFWLSIVECKSEDYHAKELALVQKSPGQFLGISLVPIRAWADGACPTEDTIDLLDCANYGISEAVMLRNCISKAEEYLSRFI